MDCATWENTSLRKTTLRCIMNYKHVQDKLLICSCVESALMCNYVINTKAFCASKHSTATGEWCHRSLGDYGEQGLSALSVYVGLCVTSLIRAIPQSVSVAPWGKRKIPPHHTIVPYLSQAFSHIFLHSHIWSTTGHTDTPTHAERHRRIITMPCSDICIHTHKHKFTFKNM